MCGVLTKKLKLLVRGSLCAARHAIVEAPEKPSFGAGRGNHRLEFSGADIGLNLLNHMDAAASWRKIPCHLPVPFVHSLEMKPRRERYLVFVREPGDGVFDRVDSHATAVMAQGTKAIHLA